MNDESLFAVPERNHFNTRFLDRDNLPEFIFY